MEKETRQKIISIFKDDREVKLAYLFGSQVSGDMGPLSDYDFAVYLDTRDSKKAFDVKFRLADKIQRLLKTDKVDVVLLDFTESPELKYAVIKGGELLFEREPFKVLVEPRILSEYFDFMESLRRYNLTRA